MIAFIDNYDSFTYNLVQFIGEVMLERDEILGRRRAMDRRHRADRRAGHMQGHADAIFLGQIADPLGFQNAAAGRQIGVAHADGARVEQRFETVVQIDVLAGATRRAQFAAQARPLLSQLPGKHVLEPGEVETLQGCLLYTSDAADE